MSEKANAFLGRMFDRLYNKGIDFSNLHLFYGYKNLEFHSRKVSFEQSRSNDFRNFILTVKSIKKDCDILESYIKELPRDINNVIYSFLVDVRKLTYSIHLPDDYPFSKPEWSLVKYTINNNRSIVEYDATQLYCESSFSPAMQIDSEILCYLSKLEWFHE
jgi:hypothetical protein